jgi:ATP-dependent Clp protease protease subunit
MTKKVCSEEEINIDEGQLIAMPQPTFQEVDYINREITISGDIDDTAIFRYIIPIIQMNKDDDTLGIPIKDRHPITLYISSYGGDATSGMNLIDVIKASKTPIISVSFIACSMACLIAMACHKRYCHKNSVFLIHDGLINIQNSMGKARDMYEFFGVKKDRAVREFILQHTKITKSQLSRNWRREWWITAEEGLELGLVDEIITDII